MIEPSRADLDVSDLVVSCGTGGVGAGRTVRLDPNPSARVADGDPLTAYFEIYHLRAGGDGQARFEYVYTVKSAEKDPHLAPARVRAAEGAAADLGEPRGGAGG